MSIQVSVKPPGLLYEGVTTAENRFLFKRPFLSIFSILPSLSWSVSLLYIFLSSSSTSSFSPLSVCLLILIFYFYFPYSSSQFSSYMSFTTIH